MERKYFKPKSVTWWFLGVVPVGAGLTAAFAPAVGWDAVGIAIETAAGMPPPAMIVAGMGGIGLRGAIKE